MNRLLAILAALTSLTAPAQADPPAELKAFQGQWVVSAATLGGRDHKDDFAALKLSITGGQYEATVNVLKDTGTITVDVKKSPKWLTLASAEKAGPFKGRTMPGIYEFKDGKLTVCLNSEKADRPEKFDAPEASPLMLIEFERAKK